MNSPVVEVAVCIAQGPDGRVLLAERTARQIAAGFWEMPGGKIEPGETAAEAAVRELREETGLTPVGLAPWISYEHQFATKRIRLHLFRARGLDGTPHGREGQRLAWVDPRAPHVGPVLPSNDRALFALTLPQTYQLAAWRAQDSQDGFLARLRKALAGGATLVRLRLSALPPGQAAALLARAAALAEAFPHASLLSEAAMQSKQAGLAGVHSCARMLRRQTSRPAVRVWGATCHHDDDVRRAVSMGADFVVVGPIVGDPARPHETPIGWDGLRTLTAACPVGVYAQGGVTAGHVPAALQAGAAGVVTWIDEPQYAGPGLHH